MSLNFSHCNPQSSANDLDLVFLRKLRKVADVYGKDLVITSAYRTVDYEISKKRSGNSSHCKRLAVDIAVNNGSDRLKLVYCLLGIGFKRIGVAKSFIHVDMDSDKPDSLWVYE